MSTITDPPADPEYLIKQLLAGEDPDIEKFEKELQTRSETFWHNAGFRNALKLFHKAAVGVPAYKDFLQKHKIQHEKIKSAADFSWVPITDKKNYIQQYPLAMKNWKGNPGNSKIAAISSGTSGEASIWPRSAYQEAEAAFIHELIYRYLFRIDRQQTLIVIGFPMGIYISGVATLLPSYQISKKYRATVATPGNNKNDALRIIKALQKEYEQTILIGHPFFIKDLMETGKDLGLSWKKNTLKMMFCSEEFSEEWRDYMRTLSAIDSPNSIISTYGSSEFLLMAHETPLSITLRRKMAQNKKFRKAIIKNETIPNFFQYNPLLRYAENVAGELVFTAASGLPLIRYNIHDTGELFSFESVVNEAKKNKINLPKSPAAWRLPFLGLWSRSNHKIILYAANIYPENIKYALNDKVFFPRLTGKFSLQKRYLKNMDETLDIHIELKKGIAPTAKLQQFIQSTVHKKLTAINHEFRDARERLGKKVEPEVLLWPYQHERYFKPGLKPKYIIPE